MKKAISLLLVFMMVFGIVAVGVGGLCSFKAEAAEDLQEGNFIYKVVDGKAELIRYTDWQFTGDLVIPETLGGYPVTSIGTNAFSSCNFYSIQLPSTLKNLAIDAFAWLGNSETVLSEIRISGSGYFKVVDNVLFSYAGDILYLYPRNASETTYTVPNTVLGINYYAFFRVNNLKEITTPVSVQVIGDCAFEQSSIEKVTIGGSLKHLGNRAFADSDLNEISLPNYVEYFGWDALTGTPFWNNKENYDEDGVLYHQNYLISTLNSEGKEYYEIKDGTRGIAGDAFYWNSLKEVFIPESVFFIGTNPFCSCKNLEKITVSEENGSFCSDESGSLFSKLKSVFICYPVGKRNTCYVVPEGVEKIQEFAFYNVNNLKNVYLPKTLERTGVYPFGMDYLASSITDIFYPFSAESWSHIDITYEDDMEWACVTTTANMHYNSTSNDEHTIISDNGEERICSCGYGYTPEDNEPDGTKYEENGFTYTVNGGKAEIIDCPSDIAELNIPESIGGYPVTGIDADGVLYQCKSLYIPSTVEYFEVSSGTWVWPNLESITVDPNSAYLSSDENGILYNKDKTVLIHYPDRATEKVFTVPSYVTEIKPYAFCSVDYIEELIIPGNVKKIDQYAFCYNEALKSVVLENGVEHLGYYSFLGCTLLDEVVLPSSLKFIGLSIFKQTAYINNDANYDKDGAMYNNNMLLNVRGTAINETYEIKEGTRLIASGAFSESNTSLTEVVIPNSVEFVGHSAFTSKIEKLTVSDDSQYLSVDGFGVLYNKNKTELIAYPYGRQQTCFVVPDGVTRINGYALSSERLYNIYIPDSVVELELCALGSKRGTVINYEGTEKDWENIVTDTSNVRATTTLENFKKNYNCYTVANHSMLSFTDKDSTCTESGGVSWSCSCGASGFVAENARGHNTSGVNEKTIIQPTCTETGLKGKICTTCGEVVDPVVIEKLEHNLRTVETVYSTCTENGYIKTYCSLCKTYYTEYTEPLGHLRRENAALSKIKPTCTRDGMTYHSCLRCLDKLDITVIPATGHTEGEWSYLVKPSCKSTGIEILKCVTCGEELNRRKVEATGHKYEESIVEQSCTMTTKMYFCRGCGHTYYQDTYYATGNGNHILETVTEKADCINPGRTYSKCTICNAIVGKVTETEPAKGHNHMGETTKEPTCTETGIKKFVCSDCGDTYEEAIAMKGHSVGEWVFSGDNVFTGNCRVCGTAFESITVELKLNRTKLSLIKGDNDKLIAEVTENITSDIFFSSSDSSVVSVDSKGNISAISPGTAVITAKINGTNITATCIVNVVARIYPISWMVDGKVYIVSQVKEGQKIEEPAPPEIDSFEFVDWTPEIPETMPSHAMTFTAVFNKVSKSEEFDVSATYSPDAFDEPVSLDVKEIEGEREPGGVYMIEGKYYDQIGLYNIKAINENSDVVQPKEGHTVTLRIPLPEAYRNKTSFVIYHRFVGGGREQLSTAAGTIRVENGYLIFEISNFSEFEILAETDKPDTPIDKVSPSIKVTSLPVKTVYACGEDINLTGIRVVYTNSEGEKKVVTNTKHLSVSGYNSKEVGTQTVTIRYGDCTDTFEVTVRYTFWQWIIKILTFGLVRF